MVSSQSNIEALRCSKASIANTFITKRVGKERQLGRRSHRMHLNVKVKFMQNIAIVYRYQIKYNELYTNKYTHTSYSIHACTRNIHNIIKCVPNKLP